MENIIKVVEEKGGDPETILTPIKAYHAKQDC
jgi:hypothetical protein